MRPLSAYLAAALAFIAMAVPRHGIAQASGSQRPPARADTVLAHRSGLYLSAADFQAARLEHPIDCRTATHVIDRHTVLRNSYIDVEHQGQHFRTRSETLSDIAIAMVAMSGSSMAPSIWLRRQGRSTCIRASVSSIAEGHISASLSSPLASPPTPPSSRSLW